MDLRPGLITEAGFLNSPDGSTRDEANFRIRIDGSRRRRKGLAQEVDGFALDPQATFASDHACTEAKWRNAGGDADKDFIVLQFGRHLHIFNDTGDTLSTQEVTRIDLQPFAVSGTADEASDYPVSIASGTGILLVCGRYIEPFYIEYDSSTGEFTTSLIQILERDFHTIKEGGVRFNTEPASLSNAHKYNLINRGWKRDDITQYASDKLKYPALGMLWYKGYRRQIDGTGTYIDDDGVQTWNSDKIEAEPFGNASAPTGSLLLNPFETTKGYQTEPGSFPITNWTVADTGADPWVVTVTVASHGMTHPEEFTVTGNASLYTYVETEPGAPDLTRENVAWNFNGTWDTASTPDANTFTFEINGTDRPYQFDSWDDQYLSYGYLETGGPLENDVDGYTTDERPTVCGWFAGRAWFAGIKHPQLVDRVYFSRLIRPMHREFGECYQRNDPTDETFNALLPDDGGVIVIPDIGNVLSALDYNGLLLLFSDAGVWEISGSRGVFTADNYTVRRITDIECSSKHSPILAENIVFYTGTKGIVTITPAEQTNVLYATNFSADRIQSLWNQIPQSRQRRVKTVYDDANKQLYFLFDKSSTSFTYFYTEAFVLDMRLGAFSRMTFPGTTDRCIVGALAMKDADESDTFKKVKFIIQWNSGDRLVIADMEQEGFEDFDGNEQDAYMVMAYDNIGSWAHRRQAPVVHVFCGKTETGFTEDMEVVNPGSLLMQARWDWADNIVAGEWGSSQQVYRHARPYTPTDSSDNFDTGYPVIVTRNKVRGRGRSLNLKFTAEEAKDAHLLGYAVRYKISGRI